MYTKSKVIIFDLDGTLYEDTHHFDFYARRLQSKLLAAKQNAFWDDYQLALHGKHPLKIGRVYDVQKDLILQQEHNLVKEAFMWDGSPLSNEDILPMYPGPIKMDLENTISIGDLWWLPASIARHYGLDAASGREAFLETRSFMMSPEFVMARIHGFGEALYALKDKGFKIVLLTNSPEKDSEVILTKLGFKSVFDKKVFEAQKPTHTAERFKEISEFFQVKYNELLSIGDNLVNEILPAKELGCSTILIDPHEIGQKSDADEVVRNISELIPLLKGLPVVNHLESAADTAFPT
ncbi:HAD family hydrolase [Peribacillus saganii]|uniref:HAD family hydrolase n=1 Tax=Peribacillus saganii TaxID=2303992 RepID=UPI00131491E5|nr:HAD family hydrolase [Peribacillus saganii]